MKPTHYILESTGRAACGIYVSREKFGDNITSKHENVTCRNCLRSKIYRRLPDLVTCRHGKIVGIDYRGRRHKCDCVAGAFIALPTDGK